MASKTIAQKIHARRRAQQRYGINLSRRRSERLVQLIRSPNPGGNRSKVVWIKTISNRLTRFYVWSEEEERWLLVVYDKQRKQIVTLLTPKEASLPKYIPE